MIQLHISSKLILIVSLFISLFLLIPPIEYQLYEFAKDYVRSTIDYPLYYLQYPPTIIYRSSKKLFKVYNNKTIIHIRGLSTYKIPDIIFINNNLPYLLTLTTIIHEYVHTLQALNPMGDCIYVQKNNLTYENFPEEVANCILYKEIYAYSSESDYLTYIGYNLSLF